MVDVEEETDSGTTESQDLWGSILSEVSRASSGSKTTKSVLVLGEDGSGKSSLVDRLRGLIVDFRELCCGLEYSYISVQDEDSDETASKLLVWTLDGDPTHRDLLRYAINANTLENVLAVVVVDMSRPWTVMKTLEKWMKVLRGHIDELKIPPKQLKELEERNVKAFQEYTDPDETAASPTSTVHTSNEESEASVVLPLEDNVLSQNLGIPVIVACNKCDLLSSVEKEREYKEEHLDFIQQHVRKFCLNYGATLAYVSAKTGKNCDLLYKFVVHKLCGYLFEVPASVVERDGIFIPAGWDSEKKISVLYEHMKTLKPDDEYEDRILRPSVRKGSHEVEVAAEEDNFFLMRLQTVAPLVGISAERRAAEPASRSPVAPRHQVAATGAVPRSGPSKEAKGSPGGETVLTTFFNSLLQRKPASGAGTALTAKSTDKGLSADAAAALQAMQNQDRTRKQAPSNATS